MFSYDGKRVIPAPTVTLRKVYSTTGDGKQIGSVYAITLAGTILPWQGSPSGTYETLEGAFWKLGGYPPGEEYVGGGEDHNHILRKQEALRYLFSHDGRSLEWQANNGQPVMKCNPRIKAIVFAPGTWADRCDYSVEAEADWIYINGTVSVEDECATQLVSEATETWVFDDRVGFAGSGYTVTHTTTARGKRGYENTGALFNAQEAWEHARDWCEARASGTIPSGMMSAMAGSTALIGGQYVRSRNSDISAGSYSIAESWLAMPAVTFTEKSWDTSYDDEQGRFDVTFTGTIYGLADGERSGGDVAVRNAVSAIPGESGARAEAYAMVSGIIGGGVLCSGAVAKTTAISQRDGTVRFSYRWSTGEDDLDSKTEEEAQLSFDSDSGNWILNYSLLLIGVGDDKAGKLANAQSRFPTDVAANARAVELVAWQKPIDVKFSGSPDGKQVVVMEQVSRVRGSWRWGGKDENDFDEVLIETQNPSDVVALIPIPGRTIGPIIQDMNCRTERYITVTVRGKGYSVRPTASGTAQQCDSYLAIPTSGYKIAGDNETWSPLSKKYTRSRRYLIKEGY